MVRGEIFFEKGICLRILEILDFDDEECFIQRYSYEAYRFETAQKYCEIAEISIN